MSSYIKKLYGHSRLYINGVLLLLQSVFCLSSCDNREWDVPHYGQKELKEICFVADTIFLDGSRTSLLGQWLMTPETLCFFDECVVGVKVYSLSGDFVDEYVQEGRGPNEMISPSWISAYDPESRTFVIQDVNARLHRFDANFSCIWESRAAWFLTKSSRASNQKAMRKLYDYPDSEAHEIYEYNLDCHRIVATQNSIIMPIVSDHIKFNKYFITSHSREYFRTAHIFMQYETDSLDTAPLLFGNYPPVYKKGTLSMFSEYDFFQDKDTIFVSFAASPKIYKMLLDGTVLSSFGYPEKDITARYPAIRTFQAYEEKYREQRDKYGYYSRLSCYNGYVFRTCKLDGTHLWKLQVYERKNGNQIYDIEIPNNIEILGHADGFYYAAVGEDLEKECFIIIRFKLP